MIILDTCTFIWDALSHPKLSKTATLEIEKAEAVGQLMISDITLWEVAMLVNRRRIKIPVTAANFSQLAIQARDIHIQKITADIAELSVSFDKTINNDPADRIIAATSVIYSATLLTADNNLRQSPLLDTLW